MIKENFTDLIVWDEEIEKVVLCEEPFSTAAIDIVVFQIEKNGTTDFWKEQIKKWEIEERI